MRNKKLTIGLLLPSHIVPFWVERIVRLLRGDASVEIAAIILSPVTQSKQLPVMYRLYESFDRRRGVPRFDRNDVELDFKDVPVVMLADAQPTTLPAEFDFIFSAGVSANTIQLRERCRFGIWNLSQGEGMDSVDPLVGFWEVYFGKKQSLVTLEAQCTNRTVDIGHSELRSHPSSPSLNRFNMLAAGIGLMQCALQRLKSCSEERDFFAGRPVATTGHPTTMPTTWQIVSFLIRNAAKIFSHKLRALGALEQWSVAMVAGSPLAISSEKLAEAEWFPSPKDGYVADPFLVEHEGRRFVFVEEFPYSVRRGQISVIEINEQGDYSAPQAVLQTGHHLSFPMITQHKDRLYLLPEQATTDQIVLYECLSFPLKWQPRRILVDGFPGVDNVLFHHENIWWLFTSYGGYGNQDNNLHLYFADDFFGEFLPHPMNPVKEDISASRMAGKVFCEGGRIIRPAQNCAERYGNSVVFCEIQELTKTAYRERVLHEVRPSSASPFPSGFHTVNCEGGFSVVSGRRYIRSPYERELCR